MSDRIPFIIYRDVILTLSETFIAAPAPMLRRYEAWFTGTAIRPHELVDPARTIAPGASTAWRKALFKLGGIVPDEWLEQMRSHAPRLLHAQFGTDGVFAWPIAKRLGIPLVVTFFGFDATIRSASPVWKAYEFRRRQLYRRAAQILTVSEFIREKLIADGCPPERVETHYTGIDTERFERSDEESSEPFVLFVGRLVEKKGCADLIEAVRRVQALRLVVIGDGPLRDSLEKQAEGLNVSFLGACAPAEVRAWMNRAAIFALPSRSARSGDAEGLPFVILEAQSMGLPVVSTRHAGIPEAVVDGETGFLCDEGDVESIAANLLRLSRDEPLRRKMGSAGRDRMRLQFDLRTQTGKLEALYDRVLARPTRGL